MMYQTATAVKCYHCGQPCTETLWINDKSFCCYGCKTVFEILQENDLCDYYNYDTAPGLTAQPTDSNYSYLDQTDIRKKLIEFDSPDFSRVRFYVPAIHCSSCIWLLEHLERINGGITKSEVNFVNKTVSIDFNPGKVALSVIAEVMSKIGYAPRITLNEETKRAPSSTKVLVLKLTLAGFCFGNVMLFSFPEYLGLDHNDFQLMRTFSWLNLALSIPVLLYSAREYFTSARASFRQKQINIDVPIALGLCALFLRSAYDIITMSGPGYLDSFTGLVFFLLIGRWFQSKTYETLSFERDFKSYFPLAVYKSIGDQWKPLIIYDLRKGDMIRIRNMEIVPADSILLDETAFVDYSFVTGESKPVKAKRNEIVYAGGRLLGQPVRLIVDKDVSSSHLTSLWNHESFRKVNESKYKKIIDQAARRFTWIVMGIALVTAVYWYMVAPSQMWLVITSVLMVACPCALALAAPFTYGTMLRAMGRHKLYLKNADVIERLASINAVVFDKTGTVTTGTNPLIQFHGEISEEEENWIKTLTSYSTHPLSTLITQQLEGKFEHHVQDFREIPGRGISAEINNHFVEIGSPSFVGIREPLPSGASYVAIKIDGNIKGYYSVTTPVRKYMKAMLKRLGQRCVAVLSGDNEGDRDKMQSLFPTSTELRFHQSPQDKREYIKQLQAEGQKVLMIGDGLNDAGALKQSDVGFAVTDDTAVFTPACDGIITGDQLNKLDHLIELSKTSTRILKTAFAISFLYNAVALTFAVTGNLTPLVAAILMPVSSISVVSFSSIAVHIATNRKLKTIHA